jgi:hypothetical protein
VDCTIPDLFGRAIRIFLDLLDLGLASFGEKTIHDLQRTAFWKH